MAEAQTVKGNTMSRQVGFYVSESLKPVYREIAGLLGVPFAVDGIGDTGGDNQIFAAFQAIVVDGISLTPLSSFFSNHAGQSQIKPLILVCGPVRGETSGLRLHNFSFKLGEEAGRLLMSGREYTEKQVYEPALDLMIEEIREVLRREVINYLELPPIPWGHSYAMILTHDIDILSLTEMPIARTFLGYFYRSSVLNWKRWRAGKVRTSEFYRTLWEMVRTWAAKAGLGSDVWKRALPELLKLEKRLGVRSSLYFMPFPKRPGILPEALQKDSDRVRTQVQTLAPAPANRASFYDVVNFKELLKGLEDDGWEAGVHGIDAWHDSRSAREEYLRVANLTEQAKIGVRMHWLYFQSPDSFQSLESGGFEYDSTFGFNEVVGFRAGTLQPYHPLNCRNLWELPLHIQDGALLGEEHLDLNRKEAFLRAKPILDWAKRLGGVVSLLWHNQSFTAPRFWGEVYERLIAQGNEDGAWIAIPRDVLSWFKERRQCEAALTIEGSHWQIRCRQVSQGQESPAEGKSKDIPPVRIRLYLDPKRIRRASVSYAAGDGYVDFPAQALIELDVEGEG
ncbi:hypothetical protein Desor_5329 [Desulfosporosinus orientis DSM 765]|uniref:NodB homology domain-containing protein n=1 Tax=Desulfosporosinus orientis (strain ATCC 19365 / DSM 765 / NCIMB 8382 / VKM B-1628 / Singapore I) TaxID=768706 RepID=G7WC89_DESOD|nr:hypothetical protein [Desulfosporosinus orientis]AET70707.1 hypothetical protein Desor_5329 [Desulfosporosinus orientis DSM 765]